MGGLWLPYPLPIQVVIPNEKYQPNWSEVGAGFTAPPRYSLCLTRLPSDTKVTVPDVHVSNVGMFSS